MMTTLFVMLFLISAIAIGVSLALGAISQFGLLIAVPSGLLSLFGVGILYLSANVGQ